VRLAYPLDAAFIEESVAKSSERKSEPTTKETTSEKPPDQLGSVSAHFQTVREPPSCCWIADI